MNNLLKLNKIDPEEVRRSQSWFSAQIKTLAGQQITSTKLMQSSGLKQTGSLKPGRMYFYFYDTKFKDTLPYYDRFPLLLPFDKTSDSFVGLNLHYLDYKPRMILFQELIKVANAKHIDENSKLRYNWDMIKSVSKMRMAGPCVKRYLMNHVRSPFCEVEPQYWHTAVMMPVQKFVGASTSTIWKESIRKS